MTINVFYLPPVSLVHNYIGINVKFHKFLASLSFFLHCRMKVHRLSFSNKPSNSILSAITYNSYVNGKETSEGSNLITLWCHWVLLGKFASPILNLYLWATQTEGTIAPRTSNWDTELWLCCHLLLLALSCFVSFV